MFQEKKKKKQMITSRVRGRRLAFGMFKSVTFSLDCVTLTQGIY